MKQSEEHNSLCAEFVNMKLLRFLTIPVLLVGLGYFYLSTPDLADELPLQESKGDLSPTISKNGYNEEPASNAISEKAFDSDEPQETVELPTFANPDYQPNFVKGSFSKKDNEDSQQNTDEYSQSEEKQSEKVSKNNTAADQDQFESSDNEPFFTPEELVALRGEDKNRNRRRGGGGLPQITSNQTTTSPTTENEETDEDGDDEPSSLPRVGGQVRGYQLLPLMHPRARPMVEAHIQLLIASEIQEIYLGVLTDGTFGWDPNYLTDVINRLSTGGRELTLALYLTNGSTMRIYDTTNINAGFNKIEPEEFRSRIKFDPSVRSTFVNLVQRVRPIFVFNSSLSANNKNIAVMMLEDNLDRDSYFAMKALARGILGNGVLYMRNPCPGCYEGNDSDAGGDNLEHHGPAEFPSMQFNDGFTLDGTSFIHPFEAPLATEMNVPQVQSLMDASRERQALFFGLWRFDRQGLTPGQAPPHPDQRNYVVPTQAHRDAEIELLRYGLTPLEPSEEIIPEE